MLEGKTILDLAIDLAVGAVTADLIQEELGDGILNSVLALTGGAIGAAAVHKGLEIVDRNTGIVSDIGSCIDDVFSIFD